MKAQIISIGDELLNGQTLNTNAYWMAEQLTLIGCEVVKMTTISDNEHQIYTSLDEALRRADIILFTGGLGPTNDDLTLSVLNDYYKGDLILNQDVLNDVEQILKHRNRPMLQSNINQALVPNNAIAIRNKRGTAPGICYNYEDKLVVAMPGVPYEMKEMMIKNVIPSIAEKYNLPKIVNRFVYTQGIGESYLAEKIKNWENSLPNSIKLAYLPSPGIVKLRLTSIGKDIQSIIDLIDKEKKKLYELIPEYIYSEDKVKLEEVVGNLLLKTKSSVSTAESCTGGYIAHLLTSIPGSSEYFKGSVISYSNNVKIDELNVLDKDIENYGAVSKQVVEQMAKQVRIKLKTSFSIATSGVAGPSGGTVEKPVGTVWIAVASSKGVVSKKFVFTNNREININISSVTALNMLRKEILKSS